MFRHSRKRPFDGFCSGNFAPHADFRVRAFYNGSQGTDHGAGGVMMAIGGAVRDGIYGTAPSLDPNSPTLENNGGDVRYETDFRAGAPAIV